MRCIIMEGGEIRMPRPRMDGEEGREEVWRTWGSKQQGGLKVGWLDKVPLLGLGPGNAGSNGDGSATGW
jgi:hypothetical protein